MKKKIMLVMIIFVLTVAVIPIRSYACGGFVSIRGSKEYHSIYCDLIEGADFGKLRWFDTSEQAKASGLNSCSECEQYTDWDFECSYYDPYWKTDDHLLWSAMEMEYDIGLENGNENGYEIGYGDGQTDSEYSARDYYGAGYDEGYNAGKGNGSDYGYDEGFDAGKKTGYNDGYRIGYEEGKNSEQPNTMSFLLTVIALCVLSFYFGQRIKRNTLEEYMKKHSSGSQKTRSEVGEQEDIMNLLSLIAKECNISVKELMDSLYINLCKGRGLTEEEAKAKLRAHKLERSEIQ